MPQYVFAAGSPQILLGQLADDERVKAAFRPYGTYKPRTRQDLRPILLKLLNVLTGGDLFSFLNDILTPYDVAEHIYPANKVTVYLYNYSSLDILLCESDPDCVRPHSRHKLLV